MPLFRYAGIGQRGRLPPALPRHWPDKRASDVLDYGLDCREFLAGVDDEIVGVTMAISPAGAEPEVERLASFGGLLIAWLSGGAPGSYVAHWTLSLRSGQRLAADVAIVVSDAPALDAPPMLELAVRPDPASALLTRDGTPLLPACGALLSAATTRTGAALEIEAGGVLQFRGF
ncbi:MAG: hypothetical protein WDN25_24760 [Acetobacteraceae bacterium]